MGDAHAAQGDSELDGTGIETSITGTFKLTVIKKDTFTLAEESLDFPLGETDKEWMVHGSVILVCCVFNRNLCSASVTDSVSHFDRFVAPHFLL
jgi:acetamidase/formamidase